MQPNPMFCASDTYRNGPPAGWLLQPSSDQSQDMQPSPRIPEEGNLLLGLVHFLPSNRIALWRRLVVDIRALGRFGKLKNEYKPYVQLDSPSEAAVESVEAQTHTHTHTHTHSHSQTGSIPDRLKWPIPIKLKRRLRE